MDQTNQTQQSEKTRENLLRRKARKHGYVLKKSRVRNPHLNDQGGYMIVDAQFNSVAGGSNFDLSLDDIAHFLD